MGDLMGTAWLISRWIFISLCCFSSVRKEVWNVVCQAALTAMLRARGLMFSTLARTGLEPAVVEIGHLIFSLQP